MKMVDYAVNYQKLGYSVIPISKIGKQPLVAFADQPPADEMQIRRWWRDFPDANIALRTIDFFVIDCDIREDCDGLQNLREWEHARKIPKTLQATTPSGGRHIYFKKRDDIQISQNIGFLPGVDLKAHVNNYILVPPSNNEKGSYRWDKERSPKDGSITVAPFELVSALKELQDDNREEEYEGISQFSDSVRYSSKTTRLFETIISGFQTGQRNNDLTSFVGGLLIRNVDVQIAYELAKLANNNSQEPLSAKEFQRTFESILKKDRRR